MSVQSHIIAEQINFNRSNARFVAVYLCYPDFTKSTMKQICRKNYRQLEQQLTTHPIFLNKKHAMQYSRFMGNNHSILKLFVPESAIVADGVTFCLKHGFVSTTNIHGYFPNFGQDDDYCANPLFDETRLTQRMA